MVIIFYSLANISISNYSDNMSYPYVLKCYQLILRTHIFIVKYYMLLYTVDKDVLSEITCAKEIKRVRLMYLQYITN